MSQYQVIFQTFILTKAMHSAYSESPMTSQ